MNTSKPLYKQKGFILIESLVAVFVIAFGSLAVTKMQGNLVKGNSVAKQRSEATLLAQRKIEELRNYSQISVFNAIASSSDTVGADNTSYTRTLTITNNINPNYKQVNVAVTWSTRESDTESITLTSMINESDPALAGKLILPKPTPTLSPSVPTAILPNGATDNGDGTSDYVVPNTSPTVTLTYDNSTGGVTKINGATAITLAGSITEGTGGDSPSGGFNISSVVVSPSSSYTYYCTQGLENGSINYSCVLANAWSGNINLSGFTGAKVCTNTTQPYSNLVSNVSNQDFNVIKSTKTCSGSTATEHQVL